MAVPNVGCASAYFWKRNRFTLYIITQSLKVHNPETAKGFIPNIDQHRILLLEAPNTLGFAGETKLPFIGQ